MCSSLVRYGKARYYLGSESAITRLEQIRCEFIISKQITLIYYSNEFPEPLAVHHFEKVAVSE